jgi:hypothetical protein
MNKDEIDAGLDQGRHEPERLDHAEVDFKGQPRPGPKGGDGARGEAEVSYKVPVEDIEVDEVQLRRLQPRQLFSETAMVRIEQGGPEANTRG